MLIDINAYIGHWPFRQLRGNTLDALVERMNRFGVDQAVVANINGIFYKASDFGNRELHEAINANDEFRERIIPFAVMNPVLPWWERALEESHEQLGMKGIRLYPLYHKYDLTDSRCIELVEAARDRGMTVAIPQRMVDIRQRSWLDVSEELDYEDIAMLVREVPDAKYMMLDTRHRVNDEAREILEQADILFDTTRASGTPITGLNGASFPYLIDMFGPEKMAFGTGTPFIDYYSPFIRLYAFEEADEQTKEMIRSGNARRMLDMD
ncbi:MAG: hypothetical protein WD317_08905 [Balneolaceae bacterium]